MDKQTQLKQIKGECIYCGNPIKDLQKYKTGRHIKGTRKVKYKECTKCKKAQCQLN